MIRTITTWHQERFGVETVIIFFPKRVQPYHHAISMKRESRRGTFAETDPGTLFRHFHFVSRKRKAREQRCTVSLLEVWQRRLQFQIQIDNQFIRYKVTFSFDFSFSEILFTVRKERILNTAVHPENTW